MIAFNHLDESTLQATCQLSALPERVYDAWTDPAQLAMWFTPSVDFGLHIHNFDCQEGGTYSLTMKHPDGEVYDLSGEFVKLDRPKGLAFTWQWANDYLTPEPTLVTISLEPAGSGTTLTLVHERFATIEARDAHNKGWQPCFERLTSYLHE